MDILNAKFQSPEGKPYSELEWLDNHHSIKSRLRSELIFSLPINDGDSVLDIGCGTGTWALLIAHKIGHKGNILGIDLDNEAIEFAKKKSKLHHYSDQLEFKCLDVMNLNSNNKFDVITLFNCLSYIENPAFVLSKLSNLLKPNGTIIIKDSDLGSDFFWPIDRTFYHQLMSKIESWQLLSSIKNYNPFFARKIPTLIEISGLELISTVIQSHSFCYPVDAKEKLYITENGKMISTFLDKYGYRTEARKWEKQFDSENPNCLFHDKGFLYSMSEFLFYARVPSNS